MYYNRMDRGVSVDRGDERLEPAGIQIFNLEDNVEPVKDLGKEQRFERENSSPEPQ